MNVWTVHKDKKSGRCREAAVMGFDCIHIVNPVFILLFNKPFPNFKDFGHKHEREHGG